MSELLKRFATKKRLTVQELEVLAKKAAEVVSTPEETVVEESAKEVEAEEPVKESVEEIPVVEAPVLLGKPVVEEAKETFATLTSRRNKSKRYGLVQD